MSNRERSIDYGFTLMAALATAFIIYGSLFPFQFRNEPGGEGALRSLIGTWRNRPGRGDVLANLVLYLPYGMFWVASWRRWAAPARVLCITATGTILSVAVELAQFYIQGRVSSLSDVYANAFGSLLGAVAGTVLFHSPDSLVILKINRRPFVLLLLGCWVGFRLFPYVPTIDLHKYWTAVRPLIVSPSLSLPGLYEHTAAWLAAAALLEALGGTSRSRISIFVFAASVLIARIFVLNAILSPAEVGGALLASLAWSVALAPHAARSKIVGALFVGGVVIQALAPFNFTAALHAFEWTPFLGFMQGSIAVNIPSLFEKLFTYGSLVWLVTRAGLSLIVSAALSCGLVFGLRLMHVFLPGRSASITDAIMVLLFAVAIKLLREDPRRTGDGAPARASWWHGLMLNFYDRLTLDDAVQPVDLIFVLAGRMERKQYALELYRAGVAPRLVLSVGRFEVSKMGNLDLALSDRLVELRGRTAAGERHFFVEMDTSGMRAEKVRLARWSTFGEVLALQPLLAGAGIRKVMVISTGLHLRRVALTFSKVFGGMPVSFCYCPVPERLALPARSGWWTRPGDRQYVIRETLKLAGYEAIFSAPPWAQRRLMRLKY